MIRSFVWTVCRRTRARTRVTTVRIQVYQKSKETVRSQRGIERGKGKGKGNETVRDR
jgi:hypothetical protein